MSDNLEKKNNNAPLILLLIAVFVLIFSVFMGKTANQLKEKDYENYQTHQEEQAEELPSPVNPEFSQDLKINPLEEYNYKTKKEIYDIRKKYVKESLFYTPYYEPNEEIFGQIADGKPWWGLEHVICTDSKDNTTGVSNLSKFINNPNLLVVVGQSYTFYKSPDMDWFCNSEFAKYIPFELKYDADEKMITAKYKMSRYLIDNAKKYGGGHDSSYYITLQGINAKDFGYRYGKLYNLYNISMRNTPNATEHFYEFADYIHLGGSCKKEGGCNNISPYQPELDFHINELPAELTVGLRKTNSDIFDINYDFKYKIIFEEE